MGQRNEKEMYEEEAEMKNQHEEMEGLLRGELDKEAQAILDEIASDESLKDLKLPDENEAALMQKIQELEEKKAAYDKLSKEDKEALRLGREMQAQKENGAHGAGSGEKEDAAKTVVPFKKRRRKVYLLIAVVAVLAFAMSMTSIGEVPLVTEIKNQILGTSKMVKMNSEREGDESVVEGAHTEAEAYEEIKNTFGVEAVQFGYLPDGVTFLDYEIDAVLNRASLFFQCQDSILEYKVSIYPLKQASGYEVEDKLLSEETLIVHDIPIELKCYEIPDSKEIQYVAHFEYENIYYTLNTMTDIAKDEILKILKNMKFL